MWCLRRHTWKRSINFCKYTAHLRCRFTKNSPRRTTSTPAGVFCALLASVPSICKSAGGTHLLRYCAQINPQRIRTDRDVRGSKQKQVCSCKLVAQECARTHILERGWRWFYPESSSHCELVAISERRHPYRIAYTVRNVEPYAQTVPGLLLGTVRQKLSSMRMKNADLTFSAKTL